MRFLFVPTSIGIEMNQVVATLINSLKQKNLSLALFDPIHQKENVFSTQLSIPSYKGIDLIEVDQLIAKNEWDDLIEIMITDYFDLDLTNYDAVLVQGIYPSDDRPYLFGLNRYLASALNANVILLIDVKGKDVQTVVHLIQSHCYQSFESGTVILGYVLVGLENKTDNTFSTLVKNSLEKSKLSLIDVTLKRDQELKNQLSKQNRELINTEYLLQSIKDHSEDTRMAPATFRHQIICLANKANKKIVLPEGNEPRTIQAAIICHEKSIAQCILLAKRYEVEQYAKSNDLVLPQDLEIIDPEEVAINYVDALVEIRKNKGLSKEDARKLLNSSVYVGTMMLKLDEVDGLVSGAVHTTADTIRPALQLIKTEEGSTMVSSVFFMLMPEEVLVFGDCAVNPEPNEEELAEIALQSAQSASAFGIPPKVALISYSTMTSGEGPQVDKVKNATRIANTKRPDLAIDGPLQYDAAVVPNVGIKKAPNSKVAGKANVLIFPDLNTGNTVYKAVQRSANVLSIGPMLQGLKKPVNDLSRGALVDDIVFTIALTAIQAVQKNK